jgi:hypothetical protein
MYDKPPMRLSAVIDLYYLEALSTINAPVGHRAKENLANDIAYYKKTLAIDYARSLHDYLFLICFGEARHGMHHIYGNGFFYPEIMYKDRKDVYSLARDYSPQKTFPMLGNLFLNNVWESSYGGAAWYNITQAALKYYDPSWTALVFIDHVIDICHNGGLAFDKDETAVYIPFIIDITPKDLNWFLTFKRDGDLLKDIPKLRLASKMSLKVRGMLKRYFTLYHDGDTPEWLNDVSRYGKQVYSLFPEYPILEWGDLTITKTEPCKSYMYDDDPNEKNPLNKSINKRHYYRYTRKVKELTNEYKNEITRRK